VSVSDSLSGRCSLAGALSDTGLSEDEIAAYFDTSKPLPE